MGRSRTVERKSAKAKGTRKGVGAMAGASTGASAAADVLTDPLEAAATAPVAATSQDTTAFGSGGAFANQAGMYTVANGDTLWGIAASQLGDGGRWNELYSLNATVIGPDPGSISPGQILILPGGHSTEAAAPTVAGEDAVCEDPTATGTVEATPAIVSPSEWQGRFYLGVVEGVALSFLEIPEILAEIPDMFQKLLTAGAAWDLLDDYITTADVAWVAARCIEIGSAYVIARLSQVTADDLAALAVDLGTHVNQNPRELGNQVGSFLGLRKIKSVVRGIDTVAGAVFSAAAISAMLEDLTVRTAESVREGLVDMFEQDLLPMLDEYLDIVADDVNACML